MSDPVHKTHNRYVLPASRRIHAAPHRRPDAGLLPKRSPDRFILAEQFRVTSSKSVLRLRPQDAISASETETAEVAQVKATGKLVLGRDLRHNGGSTAGKAAGAAKLHRTDVSELTAKIAALETAIAQTSDRWEPDGVSLDAYAGKRGPAMTWEDTDELDATGLWKALVNEQPQGGDTNAPVALSELEQEVLRTIVADLVRGELRGVLGERIARNVRKLVRREIGRALEENNLAQVPGSPSNSN